MGRGLSTRQFLGYSFSLFRYWIERQLLLFSNNIYVLFDVYKLMMNQTWESIYIEVIVDKLRNNKIV